MDEEFDGLYFTWLVDSVLDVRPLDEGANVIEVLDTLFRSKFEWHVEFDRNRAADGVSLRREFLFENNGLNGLLDDRRAQWEGLECSVLEMLIGLANRMALQTDHSIKSCFWHMMRNVGISKDSTPSEVNDAADLIVNRLYRYDGSDGGLFPLQDPDKDQREVELLYQMYAYILENEF